MSATSRERLACWAVSLAAAALLVAAGAWDIFVVTCWSSGASYERLASPYTVSYALYSASSHYPALAWLFGAVSVAVGRYAWRPVALVWFGACGHIWFCTFRLIAV